jgi:transposase InsO family protein
VCSLCEKFSIRQVFGAPYHPQSQGQVERLNSTLKTMQKNVMRSENNLTWIHLINSIVYEYNIKRHRATNESPVSMFLNVRGFNTDINLLQHTNTLLTTELSAEEINEISEYRRRYLMELSRTITVIRRRNNNTEIN